MIEEKHKRSRCLTRLICLHCNDSSNLLCSYLLTLSPAPRCRHLTTVPTVSAAPEFSLQKRILEACQGGLDFSGTCGNRLRICCLQEQLKIKDGFILFLENSLNLLLPQQIDEFLLISGHENDG